MAEDSKTPPPSAPAWQRSQGERVDDQSTADQSTADQSTADQSTADQSTADQSTADQSTADQSTTDQNTDDQLAVARRFLEDDQVKAAHREQKVGFLKAKGVSDAHIDNLLTETDQPAPSDQASTAEEHTFSTTTTPTSPPEAPSIPLPHSDRAPVVTYPEFLAKPQSSSPPPLVTTAGLLTTFQVAAALSALVAGSSRLLLAPMLDRLTASREDFHAATFTRLADLVSLLERSVSVVPPSPASRRAKTNGSPVDYGSESDEDPTEMFHRDVGTQTALPVPSLADAPKPPPHEAQATRLSSLTRSLGEICGGMRSQSDGLSDVKSLIDVLRDDVDALTYRSPMVDMAGGASDALGRGKLDSDDEMRKVRDNIRRVKGVLLSTRSFPGR